MSNPPIVSHFDGTSGSLPGDPVTPALRSLGRLAQSALDVTGVAITIPETDRAQIHECVGLGPQHGAALSFVQYAIGAIGFPTFASELSVDPRFAANPLVTGAPFVRSYFGTPICRMGQAVGVLSLFSCDPDAGVPEARQAILSSIVAQIEAVLALRSEMADLRARDRDRRLAERKMALTEELAGVGYWSLDAETAEVTWSDQVYHIHGLEPGLFDPQLQDALDFYEDDSRQRVANHVARSIATGEGFACKARLKRASDGATRIVMSRGEPSRHPISGRMTVFGVFQDVTDQDVMVQHVTDERERYKLLTQNSTDVIATYQPDATFTYLSPAISSLVGRTPEELVGRKTFEIIHPEDHQRVLAEFQTLLKSGAASSRIEYRAVRADGEVLWVEAHPTPILDAQGRLTGFQDVVRDVSARRAAETAAREASVRAEEARAAASESEARYRLLADNSNDMIAITSPVDSTIRFVSQACCRVLGYEADELVGRTTLSLTHPDDAGRVVQFFASLVAAGPQVRPSPYQFRGLHKSGDWIWLEGQPRVQFDAAGKPSHFQDVVRDITARRRAEEAARVAAEEAERARAIASESEARYRLLAENATDMISRLSLNGRIKFISPSSERLLGYTSGEMIGRRTVEFIHPDDIAALSDQHIAHIAAGPGGPPLETRFRAIRKDGDVIWLEGRPSLVFSPDGRPLEYYDVVRDVTARKALEDELNAARIAAEAAAQAKSDFLANMSHELRTPLTAIIGFSGLMAEDPALAAPTRRHLDRVRSASTALLTTVNDVLDFSKLEAGQVEICPWPTDPKEVLSEVVDLLSAQASAKGITLQATGMAALPAVLELDIDRVRQVLTNLVGNAVKFTAQGRVRLNATYSDGALTVEVTDTGPGIPPERISVLFQRFSQVDGSSTRKYGGTGLGLAISKGLVDAMGGQIGVRSRLGQGSTFFIQIPARVGEESNISDQVAPINDAQPIAAHVLVVDDNSINRELVGLILSSHGCAVSMAEDGEQALAMTQHSVFDLILLDRHMPGIDGEMVARQLRQDEGLNAGAILLAFTADVLSELSEDFDGSVSKPLTPANLVETISRHLDSGRPLAREPRRAVV